MSKYYKKGNSLFKSMGNGIYRCVASTRKSMIGVMEIKPSGMVPVSSYNDAILQMEEDAYLDNTIIYKEEYQDE